MPYFLARALSTVRAGLVRPAFTSASPSRMAAIVFVAFRLGGRFPAAFGSGGVLHHDFRLAVDGEHDRLAGLVQRAR